MLLMRETVLLNRQVLVYQTGIYFNSYYYKEVHKYKIK